MKNIKFLEPFFIWLKGAHWRHIFRSVLSAPLCRFLPVCGVGASSHNKKSARHFAISAYENRFLNCQKGYTLIELIMGLVLFAAVMTSCFGLLAYSKRVLGMSLEAANTQSVLRKMLADIKGEISFAEYIEIIDTPDGLSGDTADGYGTMYLDESTQTLCISNGISYDSISGFDITFSAGRCIETDALGRATGGSRRLEVNISARIEGKMVEISEGFYVLNLHFTDDYIHGPMEGKGIKYIASD